MKINLSLAQFDIQLGEVEENYNTASKMIAEAASKGSQIVLLPELWNSGYDLENWSRYAFPLDTPGFNRVASLARLNNIWVGGTTLEDFGGKPYNTFTLFDNQGELKTYYRKIHLFKPVSENRWLGSGDRPISFDTQWGKIGLAICYDLRFPELFRRYSLEGSILVLLPAEWPASRLEHWRTLLQARAIENLYFVAAVNRVGKSLEGVYGGHSVIIGPWGNRLVEGGDKEELLTCEINLEDINRARSKITVFEDRHPEIYGDLYSDS